MRPLVRLLFGVLLVLLSQSASAADTCDPVRPAGLSPEAVDRVVAERVAEALGVPLASLDPSKTMGQLDRSEDAIIRYAVAVVGIHDALAFDAAEAFHQANLATGKEHPVEGLPIHSMQTIARNAYFAGVDSPPPLVSEGTTYATRRFTVTVPAHPSGWSLILCNHDQFAFRLVDSRLGAVYAAAARDISLQPFTGEDAFLSHVRAAAARMAPRGYELTSVETRMEKLEGPPCAFLRLSARANAASVPRVQADESYLVYARFCYDSQYPHLGYAALFSSMGASPTQHVDELARSFISGVRRAR